ncbi:MAG: hypothetical protein SWE60_06110 [Thermodesulfobacteriota bacterium]|nr:hypothetical protein [Thermodesulfobacteriota bacterium]
MENFLSALLNASVDKLFIVIGVALIILWLTGGVKSIRIDEKKRPWALCFGFVFIVLGVLLFLFGQPTKKEENVIPGEAQKRHTGITKPEPVSELEKPPAQNGKPRTLEDLFGVRKKGGK